jgi:hypothetical protein
MQQNYAVRIEGIFTDFMRKEIKNA